MISVCIPAFEQFGFGQKHLSELLNSLLNQTIPFEVIVSDNSEDNDIYLLCKEYETLDLHYIKNGVKGISANTNCAISYAKYDKIKLMYMDDKFLVDDALELFSSALNHRPWAVSKYCKMDKFCQCYKTVLPKWNDEIIKGHNTIGMPSVVAFRKNEFQFDTNLKTLLDCEFYWWMKNKYGDPFIIERALIGARYWEKSQSSIQGNFKEKEYPYLVRKHNIL